MLMGQAARLNGVIFLIMLATFQYLIYCPYLDSKMLLYPHLSLYRLICLFHRKDIGLLDKHYLVHHYLFLPPNKMHRVETRFLNEKLNRDYWKPL